MNLFVHIILVTVFTATGYNAEETLPPITAEMIAKCEKDGYCEEVDGYPQEIADRLIKEAGDAILPYFTPEPSMQTPTRRLMDANPLTINYCVTKEEVITPQMAKNTDGEWRWIVKGSVQKHQSMRIETCVNNRSQCNGILQPQSGYSTECRQKYMIRDMLVLILTKDDKLRILTDQLYLKSCCNCEIVQSS